MSLTSHMRDERSPISIWLKENWDFDAMERVIQGVNSELYNRHVIADYKADAPLVGTAFDYAFRWHVQPLELKRLVAWHGTKEESLENERKALQILVEQGNSDPSVRSRASIVLAWFEGIFRGGRYHKDLLKARARYTQFALPEAVLDAWRIYSGGRNADDVQTLVYTIDEVWDGRTDSRFIPNPQFDGSSDLGGADADWIFGTTLYDVKSSWKRRPFVHGMLQQAVCYTLIDYTDKYGLDSVGVYFPRHTHVFEMSLDDVFGSRQAFLDARNDFRRVCSQLPDAVVRN